jgi:hypothetical protein
MGFFRLKAGSASVGVGLDSRRVNWKDPDPIIESDLDLAEVMPEKFEYYAGPKIGISGHGQLTIEQAKERAENLRREAEELDKQAALHEKQFQAQQRTLRAKAAAKKPVGKVAHQPPRPTSGRAPVPRQGERQQERQPDRVVEITPEETEEMERTQQEEQQQQEGDEGQPTPEGQEQEQEAPAQAQDDGLDAKNLPELRMIASRERIALHQVPNKKEDVVKAIRTARGTKQQG